MAQPSDVPRETAREFLDRFGDRSFAAALDLVTDDGREQIVEAFPDEFQQGDLEAEDVLEEYWWGLYGQYGDFEGVEDVAGGDGAGDDAADEGEVTADLAFAQGDEVATLEIEEEGVAGLSFAPEYEVPEYVDRDAMTEREITVDAGDVALDGILTVPDGDGPFPGIVLVHGAGIHDPDGTAGASKIHRDLAWGFATRGIATLRYEKRLANHEVADENYMLDTVVTDDAVDAVSTLADAAPVDASRGFVAGHSQGGMCAPRIAERHGDVAGVVVLDARPNSLLDPDEDRVLLRYSMEIDGDLSEEQEEELKEDLATLRRIADGDFEDDESIRGKPGVWHRSRHDYDPMATASDLDTPVFVASTSRADPAVQSDLSAALREQFETWQAADLPADSRTEFYERVNHYFQAGPTPFGWTSLHFGGNVAEHVVEDLADWIHEVGDDRVGGPAR